MKYKLVKKGKSYTFDIAITEEILDTTLLKSLFKSINQLHSTLKILQRTTPEYEFIRANLVSMRSETKFHAVKIYKLTVSLGNKSLFKQYVDLPTKDNIADATNDLVNKLSLKRKSTKTFKETQHSFNSFRYKLIGGAFTKPNTVLDLLDVDKFERIQAVKTPHPKIKSNYLGVELELICKVKLDVLQKAFIDAGLAGNVCIVHDGSIEKEQNIEYAHEVTVLFKQDNMNDIINRVCSVLNTDLIGAYVNNSCGMHVHFDVRISRSPSMVYTNLVRMLPILTKLVPANRVGTDWANQYCMYNKTDDIDVASGSKTGHDTGRARYQAINPVWTKHKTIEVRLHSGTTNATKIINWINICLFAVDSLTAIPVMNTTDEFFKHFTVDDKLKKYMLTRIELFSKKRKAMDTRADHFFSMDEVA